MGLVKLFACQDCMEVLETTEYEFRNATDEELKNAIARETLQHARKHGGICKVAWLNDRVFQVTHPVRKDDSCMISADEYKIDTVKITENYRNASRN
jgi:hypothetical protein